MTTVTERFTTPSGQTVPMQVRPDTNDHNVCYSIITEDEYRLDSVKPLTGVALDVGAHIGAASVALLAINPELRVIAVEPVPENVELLRANLAPYGDRAVIIAAALGTGKQRIAYRWSGDEVAHVHRFIANQHFPATTPHDEITVPGVTLTKIVNEHGPLAFCKIDCEGCEDRLFEDPAIVKVERIHGEFHSGPTVELRFLRGEDFAPKPKRKRKAAAK